MPYPHKLQAIADELGQPVEDVTFVADAELQEPDFYDAERAAVNDDGRAHLLTHFRGGEDPLSYRERDDCPNE